jgi:hypothetical protein
MEQIEKATGRKIMRIETNDVDEMEQVCVAIDSSICDFNVLHQKMKDALK